MTIAWLQSAIGGGPCPTLGVPSSHRSLEAGVSLDAEGCRRIHSGLVAHRSRDRTSELFAVRPRVDRSRDIRTLRDKFPRWSIRRLLHGARVSSTSGMA